MIFSLLTIVFHFTLLCIYSISLGILIFQLLPLIHLGKALFLRILLFSCIPFYPFLLILVLLFFDGFTGIFVNFIPTVYYEGIGDPFPVVQQFSDLSSLDTKTLIREAYSRVSGIYMFQCTETGGTYIGSAVNLYDRFMII